MGNCCSSRVTSSTTTVKLILVDDKLKEFANPVKVSYVLSRNPQCFVCNSDEMDFDQLLSAMDEEEELLPGQLYFALPLAWMTRRLQPEDMACLAVKASVALRRGGERCGCCNFGRVDPVAFFDDERQIESRGLVVGGGGGGGCGDWGGGVCGGKRGKFNTTLSVIFEDE